MVLSYSCNDSGLGTLLSRARDEMRSCHSEETSNPFSALSTAAENCLYFGSPLNSSSPLLELSAMARGGGVGRYDYWISTHKVEKVSIVWRCKHVGGARNV